MDKSEYDFTKIPFERIVKFGQRTMLNGGRFTVSWILGRYCNYHCSYCWDHGRSDVKDHRPLELLIKTMDRIKQQARQNGFNSFHFSFSGGEPTLHPGYLKLLEHYRSDKEASYQSCHMTTNLSPGIPWLKRYLTVTDGLDRRSITASWHREYAQKEKFSEKLLFLQENGINCTINMVMVPNVFWETYEEALYFHKKGLNVTLKPQSNRNATKVVDGYTEEQLSVLHNGMPQRDYVNDKQQVMQVELIDDEGNTWFIDQAERFNAFNFNCFKGWRCNAGYQGIIIREPDGSIKRSYSCQDKPLGYIYEDFQILNAPRVCISNSCVSSADSKIPKERDL